MTRVLSHFPDVACQVLVAAAFAFGVGSTARADVSADEQRLLARLDAQRALRDLGRLSHDTVSTPSALGRGSAVSGSAEERALAKDIAAAMHGLGLAVRTERFPVRAYQYGAITLKANGAPIQAISLHATGGTYGVRDGAPYAYGNEAEGHRLRAPLVDAGDGYAADYARLGDIGGRVVLVRRELRDWPPAQITEAAMHGARAIVFYGHPHSEEQPDALRQDSLWDHDQIPAAAISHRSGEALRRDLAAGPVEVALENRIDVGDGESQNVVGMLRGTELPDEWVVVSAHYDRWFEGAADNTSGVAALLEVARAVAGAHLKPRRSMLFIATGSEEAGLEDPERDWLAGSYAFVTRHPEVLRGAALVFNIDLIGWDPLAPSAATLVATPDIAASERGVLADLGYDSRFTIKPLTGSVTDAWNYAVVGGTATAHIERITPAYYPIYHTQVDVLRPDWYGNLQTDLRLLALSLWRAAFAPRAPVAVTAVADLVDAQLALDAARVPGASFDAARAALGELRKSADVLESAADPASARALMSVRHSLVPWLYASNDDFEQVVRTTAYADRVAALERVTAATRGGDRAAALEALGKIYEGRQCQRLSPQAYAMERAYWTGDGGWASRFGQRLPPPSPDFEAACGALNGAAEPASLAPTFDALRADAVRSVAEALALMEAKLRWASIVLRDVAHAQR